MPPNPKKVWDAAKKAYVKVEEAAAKRPVATGAATYAAGKGIDSALDKNKDKKRT